MDNKRLIVVVVFTTLLMALWWLSVTWIGQKYGYDLSQQQEQPTTQPAQTPPTDPLADPTTRPIATPPAATTPTTAPSTRVADPTALRVLAPAEPQTFILGSAEPGHERYAIRLTLNSLGAGIDEVVLNDYGLEGRGEERYHFQHPYPEQPNDTRPLATHSVTIAGQRIDLSRVSWSVNQEETTAEQVTFFVDIGNDAGPLVRVSKLIKLYPKTLADGTSDPRGGYEVLVRQTLDNLADRDLTLQTAINGPTTPPLELEYGYDRMAIAGYRGRNGRVEYDAWTIEEFTDDDQKRELITPEDPPLLWAGASSIYFNAIVRPWPLETGEGDIPYARYIRQVVAASLNPDADDKRDIRVGMRFFTTDLQTPAGGRQEVPFRVFFGPKERSLLKNEYYGAAGLRYNETLVSPFGCTWCVFQPVVDALVWLLSLFYWMFRDWGLAIVALVVVVRLLLHPITKRAQRSMMRMAKLGPEMEKLKKKYGDDKDAMAKAMQEFYREHGMAALPLGCLPLLLQTPIWIALYSTLQAELRLRGAPFLYGWTWIDDLAKPDHLVDFGQTYHVLFIPIGGLNLLPLLLAFVFYFQMKIQPQPAAMTPEQQTQQTIMKWMMVLMFPIFLYSAPSGLNLYIITSTLIGIWESRRVRAQFKLEEEQKAAEQPTLVKDKTPRTARGKKPEQKKPQKPLTGWRAKWAQLQDQVQHAQQEAARRSADRDKGKR